MGEAAVLRLEDEATEEREAFLPRGLGDEWARFAGAFDFLDAWAGLRGWALDREALGRPLAVEAAVAGGGPVLARSFAMLPRPDIDAVLGQPTFASFLVGW